MKKGKVLVKGLVVVVCLLMLSAPNIMAQCDWDYQNSICTSDLDLDCNVDANDVTIFLSGFGRSPFFNPCPPNGPAPVEKTGQTTCYDINGDVIDCAGTGQDGEYQKGVAWPNPRFTDRGNGTVIDNLTGLTWLKDANCISTNYPGFDNDGIAGDGMVNWQHALDFVAGINGGTYGVCGAGYTDWKLPNVNELSSIVDRSQHNPALPFGHPFTNVQPHYFWSSSTYIYDTYDAWYMDMRNGFVLFGNKTNNNHVWPVRGGQ